MYTLILVERVRRDASVTHKSRFTLVVLLIERAISSWDQIPIQLEVIATYIYAMRIKKSRYNCPKFFENIN